MPRVASLKLLAGSLLPFLVGACVLPPPASPAARQAAAVPATPAGGQATLPDPYAAVRADFGVRALRLAKEHYAADDLGAARRSLAEAVGVLTDTAERMEAPIRADVWILVNDLRLLRIPEDGPKLVTSHLLNDAQARAGALAAWHADSAAAHAPRQ